MLQGVFRSSGASLFIDFGCPDAADFQAGRLMFFSHPCCRQKSKTFNFQNVGKLMEMHIDIFHIFRIMKSRHNINSR